MALSFFPGLAGAEEGERIVRASLLSEETAVVPGHSLHLAVLLEPKEGWHTYWENPGDAGLATELEWTLPEGFTAGPIAWPVPERIAEGPLATYGYTGSVFLPITITVPLTLDAARYSFKVTATWLVCKDICIPESAELELELPVATSPTFSNRTELFSGYRDLRPATVERPIEVTESIGDRTISLHVPLADIFAGTAGEPITAAYFFPRQSGLILYAAEQRLAVDDETLSLSIPRADGAPKGEASGILSVNTENGRRYFDIKLAEAVPSLGEEKQEATQSAGIGLLTILLFALIGGLILNLMPCVLPVLSLKALAVAKKARGERANVVRQSLAYTLGILVSFAAIAGLLIGLQEAGKAVGWGYQMQSPAFVGFLIYLLFLVGINLSGFFHMPVILGNVGSELANESSARGSFFTGVLAAAVATPCTAPFMASAVGAALVLPPMQALLVFEALGLGLALPFLVIAAWPKLLVLLPRPGAWMETFKQFLAFPMYASVIWLLWVLTLQTGATGMAVALSGMLALMLALWMRPLFVKGINYRIAALVILALTLALSLPALSRLKIEGAMMPKDHATHGVETVEFSQAKLNELRAQGRAVFVDATAAWCITCQVNARTAIHTERTMQAFREHGVTLMIADWTLPSDEITAFLRSFGHNGVPLYVYYPPSGEPKVLPQILTETIVIDAIQPKEEQR